MGPEEELARAFRTVCSLKVDGPVVDPDPAVLDLHRQPARPANSEEAGSIALWSVFELRQGYELVLAPLRHEGTNEDEQVLPRLQPFLSQTCLHHRIDFTNVEHRLLKMNSQMMSETQQKGGG